MSKEQTKESKYVPNCCESCKGLGSPIPFCTDMFCKCHAVPARAPSNDEGKSKCCSFCQKVPTDGNCYNKECPCHTHPYVEALPACDLCRKGIVHEHEVSGNSGELSKCCEKCFVPEHDVLMAPDYMVSVAVPESCYDGECECHTKDGGKLPPPSDELLGNSEELEWIEDFNKFCIVNKFGECKYWNPGSFGYSKDDTDFPLDKFFPENIKSFIAEKIAEAYNKGFDAGGQTKGGTGRIMYEIGLEAGRKEERERTQRMIEATQTEVCGKCKHPQNAIHYHYVGCEALSKLLANLK